MGYRPHKEPLVSVITPVYNRPMAIVECTQSLISQTHHNWEQVIVDDASTDDTKQILQSAVDFRIRIIRNEINQGVARSYARGIEEARGDIIVFNDSDDISFPNRLSRIVEGLEDADVVYHSIYQSIPHSQYGFPVYAYKEAEPFSLARLKREQYIPAVIGGKKEFLIKFKPDDKYSGTWDWHFLLELARFGARFKPIRDSLYLYRRHQNSLSVQNEETGRRKESIKNIRRYLRKANWLG